MLEFSDDIFGILFAIQNELKRQCQSVGFVVNSSKPTQSSIYINTQTKNHLQKIVLKLLVHREGKYFMFFCFSRNSVAQQIMNS